RPLIEHLRDEFSQSAFALRILGRARPDEHAHGHRRLLMMSHRYNLHAVSKRLHLEWRKLDLTRWQRPRRSFGRPFHRLRPRYRRGQEPEPKAESPEPPHRDPPFGRMCSTTRLAGVKEVCA